MKKLFRNYNFEFNKTEKKILNNLCKQTYKQLEGDERFFRQSKVFLSILDKLSLPSETVKLTKEETNLIREQLEGNIKHISKKIEKGWFLKKWIYNSLLTQYKDLLKDHFRS